MDNQIAHLESILTRQVAAHEKLLSMLQRKRQLLRTADRPQLEDLSAQENQVIQSISELEKERLKLVGELTLLVDPAAKEPMRLAPLAQRLPEPHRGHLLVLRQQLKQKMVEVHRETVIARRVTESLVRHMQGLVQTVGSLITGVGLYSSHGAPPKEAMTVRTINTTA